MRVDQFCAGFAPGDAISNEALAIRSMLQCNGIESEIYSEFYEHGPGLEVKDYRSYQPAKESVLIYHHSFYTKFADLIPKLSCRKLMVSHNVTPGHFVRPYNRSFAGKLDQARELPGRIAHFFDGALADSQYNAEDLYRAGFKDVQIKPVIYSVDDPDSGEESAALREIRKTEPEVIFVGRVFPNKKHQDVLKAFYFFKKICPDARLTLVGSFHPQVLAYTTELKNLVSALGLNGSVTFTGNIADEHMHSIYKRAHLFLSMSAHEGFCVPLLEAMYFSLPVIAYSSTAVPETLSDAGILFSQKDYPAVAELMSYTLENEPLKSDMRKRQKRRLEELSPGQGLNAVKTVLSELLSVPLEK